MATRDRPTHESPFDGYRAVIDVVSSWEVLVGLAERIHLDPALPPLERERLLALVDSREPSLRPDWVRTPNG